jgi:hypothetical protein
LEFSSVSDIHIGLELLAESDISTLPSRQQRESHWGLAQYNAGSKHKPSEKVATAVNTRIDVFSDPRMQHAGQSVLIRIIILLWSNNLQVLRNLQRKKKGVEIKSAPRTKKGLN